MSRGLHPAAVARTTPEARRGRTPVERLTMGLPALVPALVWLTLRVLRGRLRTSILRYVSRRGYAAFARQDWEVNTMSMDPDRYEFLNADPARSLAGIPDRFDGIQDYIEQMDPWFEEWSGLSVSMEGDPIDLGDGRLVTFQRIRGVGKGSGIEIDERTAQVLEIERGLIVRQTHWWDRDAALRDLGIEARG